MKRLAVAGLVGGTVLFGAWWFLSGASSDRAANVGADPVIEEHLEAAVELRAQGEEEPVAEAGEERSQVASFLLSSRLTDQMGAPVPGARVSWTPLLPAFLGAWVGWSRQDWAGIERATTTTTSAADGSFSFADLPPHFEGHTSTIWITHEAHLPVFFVVSSDPDARSLPGKIALTSGPQTTVSVIDQEGLPVAGASIQQLVPVPSDSSADVLEPQALRLFQRVVLTDPDGMSLAPSWSGETLLRATHEGGQTEVWIGEPRERVTLQLQPTFQAHGTVTVDPTSQIEGQLRVLCQVQRGGQLHLLHTAPVTGGSWGPVSLPLLRVDEYRFRLEGWNAEVREIPIAPPRAGSVRRIDFHTRAGLDLWFLVLSEDEEVLAESQITAWWEVNGLRTTASGRVRDNGHVLIRGAPPGTMTFTASAPGYAPASGGPDEVPADPPVTYRVRLAPAGELSGQVTFRGEPVEDFEVTFWRAPNAFGTATQAFRARKEGRFVLDDAPLGRVWLVASASGAAPSGIQSVEVRPDDQATVLLELTEGLSARGMVIDAATKGPLGDARIQAFIEHRYRAIAPWGAPLQVEADGTFELTGLAPRRARVRFSAPGYSTHWSETFEEPGEVIDFGLIALTGRKPLVVQLDSETDIDPSRYGFWAWGAEMIAATPFGEGGSLTVDDVSAGVYYARVMRDDELLFETTVILEPGEEWLVRFPVEGPRLLRVEVEGLADYPAGLWLGATFPCPEGRDIERFARVPSNGVVEFDGVAPGGFNVNLYRVVDGEGVGAAQGHISEQDTVVPVKISASAGAYRFRVVDVRGRPVAAASIGMINEENEQAGAGRVTDAKGECSIAGLEPGEYRAAIWHRELGYLHDVPVTLGWDTEKVTEIEFVTGFSLELQLLDGTELLPGVHCTPWDEREFNGIPAATTNQNGVVKWAPLGEGTYLVRISQPGYWPTKARVTSHAEGTPTPVQVRRLGDLEIELHSVSNLSVSQLAVDVTSLEFGTNVLEWVQGGRVTSSSPVLQADATGRVRVEGLPRGDYRWTVVTTAGEAVEGIATVPPAATERVRALLP